MCPLWGQGKPLPHRGFQGEFGPISGQALERRPRGDEEQDKGKASSATPFAGHICPQCGQVREFPWALEMGSKSERKQSSAVVIPQRLLPQRKNRGQPPEGASMSKKEKFPLYLSPEKKAILERR